MKFNLNKIKFNKSEMFELLQKGWTVSGDRKKASRNGVEILAKDYKKY